jgi:CRISPR/Cas system-associated exonuclease Cas4 (RecB family)
MMLALKQAPSRPPPKVFDHISYSAVSTFQTCPLRFFFRYILKLPVKTIASSLVFGSAMHKAVQFHYEQLLVGNRGPDIDTLLGVYQDYWQSCVGQKVLFGKSETADTLGRMADRLLRIFIQSDLAHPKGVIVGVEEELRGQIIPGCPDLLARVDLIVDAGNELTVSDFKTARCSWNDYKVEDLAPQLLLYSELVKPIADGRPIKLSFAVMTKTKTPVFTVHDVPVTVRQLNRTKRTVERVWQAIQSGHFYPNPSPMNCGSCSYREPCRRWTG